jgi:large subunit ribosomal protein L16
MKFKKYFKVKYKASNKQQFSKIYQGDFGLKAQQSGILTPQIVVTTIKVIKRIVRKKNFLVNHVNPQVNTTRKPRDVRMGRGKGPFVFNVFHLKAGKILFEIRNIPEKLAYKALYFCSLKLPVKTIIVKKYDKCTNNIKNY